MCQALCQFQRTQWKAKLTGSTSPGAYHLGKKSKPQTDITRDIFSSKTGQKGIAPEVLNRESLGAIWMEWRRLKAIFAERAILLLRSVCMGVGLGTVMEVGPLTHLYQPNLLAEKTCFHPNGLCYYRPAPGNCCVLGCSHKPGQKKAPALLPNRLPGRQLISLLIKFSCPGSGWQDL